MKKYVIYTFLLLTLGLCACGVEEAPSVNLYEDGILLNSDYSVLRVMTGIFDEDYYSLDGLTDMVSSEISDISGASLEASSYNEENGYVSISLLFDNINIYDDYMGTKGFYSTVDEAYLLGRLDDLKLMSTKNDSIVSVDDEFVEKYGEYHILITDENINVYTYSKVSFMDEYASLIDDNKKEVSLHESSGYHILIFK